MFGGGGSKGDSTPPLPATSTVDVVDLTDRLDDAGADDASASVGQSSVLNLHIDGDLGGTCF